MKEEIIVLIKKDGEIQAEVNGVKGKKCVEVTEFISALGESIRTLKGDYFREGKITISPVITDLIKL
jgi:hypothetical protein